MNITFLGTASCYPTPHRGVSCTALQFETGSVWLFDVGEGSQIQLQKSQIKTGKIDKIFITHLHGDHLFGLPGLLCTLGNGGNTDFDNKVVDIYGPLGLRNYIATSLELSRSPLAYKYNVHEMIPIPSQYPKDWNEWPVDLERESYKYPLENYFDKIHAVDGNLWNLFEDNRYIVKAGPIQHRVPCFGFVIIEKDQPGSLNTQKLMELNIRPGPIYGKIKNGETLTLDDGTKVESHDFLGAPRRGRKVAIFGDTSDSSEMIEICHGADLIVHEATMEESLREKAIEFGHSTPRMAAAFASKACAKSLVLTHFSPRYLPISISEAEAKKDCSADTLLAEAENYVKTENINLKLILAHDFLKIPIERPN